MARPVVGRPIGPNESPRSRPFPVSELDVNPSPIRVRVSHLKQQVFAVWREIPAIGPFQCRRREKGRSLAPPVAATRLKGPDGRRVEQNRPVRVPCAAP